MALSRDERGALVATAGLAIAAVGAFLPWARVGGRDRSGFDTADTFLALADGALPDVLAWVGRWWYVPAFLTLVAWASVLGFGGRLARLAGVVAIVVATAMWWLFVWAGHNWDVLNVRLIGPVVTSVGLVTIGLRCGARRHAVLRIRDDDGP